MQYGEESLKLTKGKEMKIVVKEVRNPRHTPSGAIEMEVKFEHIGDFIPFAAHKDDVADHGRKLYEDAIAGKFGDIGESIMGKDVHDAGIIRREVWTILEGIKTELSTLRDADEIGMITEEESARYKMLRVYNLQATRFINGDDNAVLNGIKPVMVK